jgi:hypothetical protein
MIVLAMTRRRDSLDRRNILLPRHLFLTNEH